MATRSQDTKLNMSIRSSEDFHNRKAEISAKSEFFDTILKTYIHCYFCTFSTPSNIEDEHLRLPPTCIHINRVLNQRLPRVPTIDVRFLDTKLTLYSNCCISTLINCNVVLMPDSIGIKYPLGNTTLRFKR